MSKLSNEKIKKLKEEILTLLYHNDLKAMFTKDIANSLIRDEEFIKKLLIELKNDNLVIEVSKSQNGYEYAKWKRWSLSSKTREAYKQLI
jgi:predicted transcriptional regulator